MYLCYMEKIITILFLETEDPLDTENLNTVLG